MKMKFIIAAILAGLATAAFALNGQPYYGLQGTYVDADNLRQNKEGGGATLLLGLPVTPYFAGEFNLFGLTRKNNTSGYDEEWGAGLDLAIYPFTRTRHFAPFLLIGAGGQYEDRNIKPAGKTFADAGVGFTADLTDLIALRVDAKRYRVNDNDLVPGRRYLWDTRVSAGLQMAFAADPVIAPPPPPPVQAAPSDSDGDGVIDRIDQCPGTPHGVIVNSVGCPFPPPAPKDSDQDGVLDPDDACPGTPIGLKVDARGCAIKEAKIVLHDINFEFDSARLTAAAKLALDKVTDGLRGQPTMSLLIDGHTDSVGKVAYNLKLSTRRAASVKAYMVEAGIAASRLASAGKGESQPIASNKTMDGRAENRRVEFKVTQQ